jgi:hypothetical protein
MAVNQAAIYFKVICSLYVVAESGFSETARL